MAWVDLYLNEKASMPTIWARGNIFINGTVDERKVRAAIINDNQRGRRGCSSIPVFRDFSGISISASCYHLPLFTASNLHIFIFPICLLSGSLISNHSREVYTRIGMNSLSVCIYPAAADMACIVMILEWRLLVVICRDVVKESKL